MPIPKKEIIVKLNRPVFLGPHIINELQESKDLGLSYTADKNKVNIESIVFDAKKQKVTFNFDSDEKAGSFSFAKDLHPDELANIVYNVELLKTLHPANELTLEFRCNRYFNLTIFSVYPKQIVGEIQIETRKNQFIGYTVSKLSVNKPNFEIIDLDLIIHVQVVGDNTLKSLGFNLLTGLNVTQKARLTRVKIDNIVNQIIIGLKIDESCVDSLKGYHEYAIPISNLSMDEIHDLVDKLIEFNNVDYETKIEFAILSDTDYQCKKLVIKSYQLKINTFELELNAQRSHIIYRHYDMIKESDVESESGCVENKSIDTVEETVTDLTRPLRNIKKAFSSECITFTKASLSMANQRIDSRGFLTKAEKQELIKFVTDTINMIAEEN